MMMALLLIVVALKPSVCCVLGFCAYGAVRVALCATNL